MNTAKMRLFTVSCIAVIGLTGCGNVVGSEMKYEEKSAYMSPFFEETESTDSSDPKAEKSKTVTESITDSLIAATENEKTNTSITADLGNTTENNADSAADAGYPLSAKSDNNTPLYTDDIMPDNNNKITPHTPVSPNASGDGNVLLIAVLMEQMGNEPLRVSKEESSCLIQLLTEIKMQPIDFPDPLNMPIGGGYIMEIEGESTYKLLGGGYIQIGNSYFYDTNGKSEELSAKIGDVLYNYYGEP